MKPLSGQLLVATPRLPDKNFFRTVVLIIEHNENGALGVVLNRLADRSVETLWREVSDVECNCHHPLHLGGPVSGPLMAVHTVRELAETEIIPGLFFAAQKASLDRLVQQEKSRYRIFLGHAGWGGGQLEDEIEQGAWLVAAATLDYTFHDEDNLWETVAKQIGNHVLLESLKIKHLPDDPSVN